MSESSFSKTVEIRNAQGLHARPANLFVRKASEFASEVVLIKAGQRADGKSILSVLTLVAEQGTRLEIEATGPDAEVAVTVLSQLVESGFEEESDLAGSEGANS